VLVHRPTRQAEQLGALCETMRDALEEIGREEAVVVREGDDVAIDMSESRITRTREAGLRLEADQVEGRVSLQDRFESVVVILVDQDYAEVAVSLRLEGSEQTLRLVDAADGRDDEIK
jgi:hypothetical protein